MYGGCAQSPLPKVPEWRVQVYLLRLKAPLEQVAATSCRASKWGNRGGSSASLGPEIFQGSKAVLAEWRVLATSGDKTIRDARAQVYEMDPSVHAGGAGQANQAWLKKF